LITKDQVLSALSTVIDPDLQKDLVTLGMIEDVEIEGALVSFTLVRLPLLVRCAHNWKERCPPCRAGDDRSAGSQDSDESSRVNNPKQVEISNNQFKHVIAVGSGKGGVGKALSLQTLLSALRRKALRSDCWMPIFTVQISLACLESAEHRKLKKALK
jgi:ATP-binding protein involved in chromosome partitioning